MSPTALLLSTPVASHTSTSVILLGKGGNVY